MSETPRLYFSCGRLWTIARNTMTEIIRQKFFYILVMFGIVVLTLSRFLAQFSSIEQIKFMKDFSLAAITFFGAIIAIVSTAQLLPLELENRTIYPILAKPVFRAEFLFGKFLGMIVLLLLTVILMSLIFAGFLFYTEYQLVQSGGGASVGTPMAEATQQEVIAQIHKQTRDPDLLKAIGLIYVKVVVVSAITLLISTFATSVIFTVVASMMLYICGHLESAARQAWVGGDTLMGGGQAMLRKGMLWIITFFVPDLNAFNVADMVVNGQAVTLAYVGKTAGYGLFYSAVVLLVAHIIFQEKEI